MWFWFLFMFFHPFSVGHFVALATRSDDNVFASLGLFFQRTWIVNANFLCQIGALRANHSSHKDNQPGGKFKLSKPTEWPKSYLDLLTRFLVLIAQQPGPRGIWRTIVDSVKPTLEQERPSCFPFLLEPIEMESGYPHITPGLIRYETIWKLNWFSWSNFLKH